MATIITNDNLRKLVQTFVSNKEKLPNDLKRISIGEWDVSRVTNMQGMFYNCKEFNEPLNEWDVSNVTNMQGMFYSCVKFNQPLNDWNVSNVTNMNTMFYTCEKFNQPLNAWNVSNVTNMKNMFTHCIEFDQPLNAWNVSNVTNMQYMFFGCSAFDQPLNAWNVSNVTKMEYMFKHCPIRDSYKPGAAPEVTPMIARRTLRQFYQAHHRKLLTRDLAEKCNGETYCPITYMSLKRLRDMKRLVVLEGRCYAFYAFIQGDPPLTNPFTRQPWSEQATANIAAIRKYRFVLKEEYEGLLEKTPTRRTRRGRTARQRQHPTSTRKSATRKARTL